MTPGLDNNDTADIDASKAPLLDHLIELRSRLLKCLVAFVICFGIAFAFADQIFDFLVQPLVWAYGDRARSARSSTPSSTKRFS